MATADTDGNGSPGCSVGTVEALRSAFASGRTRDVSWRLGQLAGVRQLVVENELDIHAALAADLGRSGAEVYLTEIAPTVAEAEFALKHVERWMRLRRARLPLPLVLAAGRYYYEPLGVVLIISPWNYPVTLSLGPLVAAAAAGNAVLLKPSEQSPETSALLARLLPAYLDMDAIKVLQGGAETAQRVIAEGVEHVFFTGGIGAGRRVMEGAGAMITPVTLELGGKSPVIVARDADLAVAARRVAMVKLLNAGQSCISPDFVLVDRSVRASFVQHLGRAFERYGAAGNCQRVINIAQVERLCRLLADHGGRVVFGGKIDRGTLSVEPTLVLDPNPASALMSEEIFGPILPVVQFDAIQDAIAMVNKYPKPLALYLFSRSREVQQRVLRETSSGGVCINQVATQFIAPTLPFGGVGESGIGAYHGEWGFRQLSHCKPVVRSFTRPDLPLQYPPFTPFKEKLLRALL